MTSGHPWIADAFYVAGGVLFLVKFLTWEDAKAQPKNKRILLMVMGSALTVLLTVAVMLGNHALNRGKPLPQEVAEEVIKHLPRPLAQNAPEAEKPTARKEAPTVSQAPKHVICSVVMGQQTTGIVGWLAVNETDEPIDDVRIRIQLSRAGPEDDADRNLLLADLQNTQAINVGTLLPSMAQAVGSVSPYLMPNANKPTHYQIDIYTRYENLTQWLYATPKENSLMFDQSSDLVNQKTKVWLKRDAEKAMRRWKNWPQWWK